MEFSELRTSMKDKLIENINVFRQIITFLTKIFAEFIVNNWAIKYLNDLLFTMNANLRLITFFFSSFAGSFYNLYLHYLRYGKSKL